MFRGLHYVSADSKGRMTLVARMREELARYDDNRIVVTIDPSSQCLLLYPLHEWDIIQQKLDQLPSFQPHTRRLQRLLVGHATDLDVDVAGRILLPAPLREFASIDKRIALLGQGKKIEIWSQDIWQAQREAYLMLHNDNEIESLMDIVI